MTRQHFFGILLGIIVVSFVKSDREKNWVYERAKARAEIVRAFNIPPVRVSFNHDSTQHPMGKELHELLMSDPEFKKHFDDFNQELEVIKA